MIKSIFVVNFFLIIFLSTVLSWQDVPWKHEDYYTNFCHKQNDCKPTLLNKIIEKNYYLSELHNGDLNRFIDLMTKVPSYVRQDINKDYFNKYQKNINNDIKMSGLTMRESLHKALNRLMLTPAQIFAGDLLYMLEKSMNTDSFVEILFTVNNYGVEEIVKAFNQKSGRTIENRLTEKKGLKPLTRNLFIERVKGGSNIKKPIDSTQAAKDAYNIYMNKGSNWQVYFNELLGKESAEQMLLVFDNLNIKYGISMENFIKKFATNYIKADYLTIVKIYRNPLQYLAERLMKSMKGLGTDERMLMRLVIGRAEIDLAAMEDTFNNLPAVKNKSNLSKYIKSDISNDKCQRLLLNIFDNRATN